MRARWAYVEGKEAATRKSARIARVGFLIILYFSCRCQFSPASRRNFSTLIARYQLLLGRHCWPENFLLQFFCGWLIDTFYDKNGVAFHVNNHRTLLGEPGAFPGLFF